MAIGNSDGSIVLSTQIDNTGLKQGVRNVRSEVAKLAAEYRKAGLSQGDAMKRAWAETERLKKGTEDTTKSTRNWAKELFSLTKQYATLIKSGKGGAEEAQNLAAEIMSLVGAGAGAGAALGGVGVAIGAVIAVATAAISVIADLTRKLIDFSKEASEVAMQTESSVYRLTSIYGEASDVVGNFIDANSMALGMSKSAAASFASVYGNLFGVWADQTTNALLTNEYLRMTAVVASQTGRTVEDVQERIRSGLLGNTEAIEDLGIFVNVKTIEMTDAFKRMANGKSWRQLDAYTQQQIRSMAILEQATAKYGDQVADTSVLAKSQLSAAWQDFQSTWGTAVNTVLIPMLNVVTRIIQVATIGLQTLLGSSGKILENAGETLNKQEGITEETKDTEKAQKGVLAGFDKINILSAGNEEDTGVSGGEQGGVNIPINLTLSGTGETTGDLEEFRSECERILAPLSESLGGLFDKLMLAYDKVKQEVFIPFSEWFTTEFTPELISEFATQIDEMALSVGTLTEKMDGLSGTTVFTFLQDLVTSVSGFVIPILDFVNNLISDITRNSNELAIVLGLLWGILYPFISTLWTGVLSIIQDVITLIIELVGAIGSLLGALIEFFAFVTNDDTRQKHFQRMITHLANFGISLVNVVIGIINLMISALYATLGTVLNTLGGLLEAVLGVAGMEVDLTFPTTSVPKLDYIQKLGIPALAQGAVIPPNREFLAVLGDQKHGTNIETPLATMIEAFQMALDSRGGYNGGGNTEVILEIDGREFGRAVVEQGNRENRRIGTRLVIG